MIRNISWLLCGRPFFHQPASEHVLPLFAVRLSAYKKLSFSSQEARVSQNIVMIGPTYAKAKPPVKTFHFELNSCS